MEQLRWYDDFPDHWSRAKVMGHAELINGYPFDSERFDLSEGMPLIRIRDLYSETTEIRYTGPIHEDALVEPGDILIGMDGDFNVARWKGESALLNQRMCCLRVHDSLDERFLYYLLPFPLQLINDLKHSTTVKHLSSGEVRRIEFGLPPKEEQVAIADLLDRETAKIDALIDKKQRLLGLLEEKRTALITQAVTKGLDSDVELKDSAVEWLGQIPVAWQVVRYKEILRERSGRSTSGDEELMTVSHLTGVTPRSEKEVTMIEAESLEGYKLCSPGDLVINTMWAWMGALGIAWQHGIVSPSYNVYTPRTSAGMIPKFYDYLVRVPAHVAELTRFSKGIWKSRLRLYPDEFHEIHTVLPPEAEQIRIVRHLDQQAEKVETLRSSVETAIQCLQEYRTALISAAVTGKIDVRETAA